MIVEIYADIIFLINFFVNSVILYLAGVLRRKKIVFWRCGLGGAAAAMVYTIIIFTPLSVFANIFTSFVILAPGILIAFTTKGLRDFLLTMFVAYICAFALGGAAMASMYVLGPGQDAWSTYSFAMGHFTLQNLVVAVVISLVVLKFARERVFNKVLSKQAFCRFKIYLSNHVVELNALVDTGNSLVDPISRKPVIIAEFDKIKPLLPETVIQLYLQENQDDLAALAASFSEGGFGTRIRMIPYSAIGKSGVIAGFRPDRIEIETDGTGAKQQRSEDVIIGICDFALSKDGEYQALMNPLVI